MKLLLTFSIMFLSINLLGNSSLRGSCRCNLYFEQIATLRHEPQSRNDVANFLRVSITAFAKIDTVIINKDARLDLLTAKQALINKRTSMLTSSGMYKGFRLQVISTSNRDEAFKLKTELLSKFPEQKVYAIFQSPNFKIRIGNFLKRADAENFRQSLSKYYPSGVYVVEDTIEYTPKEGEDISN